MVPRETTQDPPEETATFLLTGVQRSTRLWEMAPAVAAAAVDRHFALVEAVVAGHGAVRTDRTGDGHGVLAVFRSTAAAVAAASTIQRSLAVVVRPDGVVVRPDGVVVRVRIGLYTGEVKRAGQDRSGVTAHRCARLCEVAHGGQTLLPAATASLVADALPDGAWLVDMGVHRLRDLSVPEHVFEPRRTGDLMPGLAATGRTPTANTTATRKPTDLYRPVSRRRPRTTVSSRRRAGRHRMTTARTPPRRRRPHRFPICAIRCPAGAPLSHSPLSPRSHGTLGPAPPNGRRFDPPTGGACEDHANLAAVRVLAG